MKISYRLSSGLVIATYLATLWTDHKLGAYRPFAPAQDLPPGTVYFDPCTMVAQIPASIRLASLVWFPTFVTILIQGFRNRAGAWYWPVLCLISFWPTVQYQLWRVRECYTPVGRIGFWALVASVCVMCFHHLLQRPAKTNLAVNEHR